MPATTASPGVEHELVAFRVGEQEFCVDILLVREIRGWSEATPLPHAPPYIRGVINLRGVVLPIIDLGCRLGLAATEASARHVIIVVQIAHQQVGLLVDAVSDILTISDDRVQPTPDVATGVSRAFVRGLLPVDERMIALLALDQVMPPPEREAA